MNVLFEVCEAGIALLLAEKHMRSLAGLPIPDDLANHLAHWVAHADTVGCRPPASTRRMTRRAQRTIRRLQRPVIA